MPMEVNLPLDELMAVDGVGLACGILKHLLERNEPPKVIAATHLHEILENDFLPMGPRLQLGHMEVQLSEESRNTEDQITYLYKSVSRYGGIQKVTDGIG